VFKGQGKGKEQFDFEQHLRDFNVPPPPPHLQAPRMPAPSAKAKGLVTVVTLASTIAKASSQSTVVRFTEETPFLQLILRAMVDEVALHPGHYLKLFMIISFITVFLLMFACFAAAQQYHKYKLLQLAAAAAPASPREDREGELAASGSGGATSSGPAADVSTIEAHRGNPESQHAIRECRTVGVMSPVHYTFGSPEPRYFHQTQGFARAWEVDIGTPFHFRTQRCKCNYCSRNLA
jgi:hypothetical protein